MKKIKNLLVIMALMLVASSTFAKEWKGTVNLKSGEVVHDNITLNGDVIVKVSGGLNCAIIKGTITGGTYTNLKIEGNLEFHSDVNIGKDNRIEVEGGILHIVAPAKITASIMRINSASNIIIEVNQGSYTLNDILEGGTALLTKTGNGTLIFKNYKMGMEKIDVWGGTIEINSLSSNPKTLLVRSNGTLRLGCQIKSCPLEGSGKVITAVTPPSYDYGGHPTQYLWNLDNFNGSIIVEKGGLGITEASVPKKNIPIELKSGAWFRISNSFNGGNSNATIILPNSISGAGDMYLENYSQGQIKLTGQNTYTGKTVLDGQTKLEVKKGEFNSTKEFVLNTEVCELILVGDNTEWNFSKPINGGVSTYNNKISTVKIKGNVTLSGNSNFTGNIEINEGTLKITANTLKVKEIHVNQASPSSPTSTLIFNPSSDMTYAGIIRPTGNNNTYRKEGAKTLTLSGKVNNTKPFEVAGGTLVVTDNLTCAVNVSNGATLNFAPLADITYPYILSGAGAVLKTGSKKLVITNASTLTGELVVKNGTLLLAKDWKGSVKISGSGIAKSNAMRTDFKESNLSKYTNDFLKTVKESSFGVEGNASIKISGNLTLDGGSIMVHAGKTTPEIEVLGKTVISMTSSSDVKSTPISIVDIPSTFAKEQIGKQYPLIKVADWQRVIADDFTLDINVQKLGGDIKIDGNTLYLVKERAGYVRDPKDPITVKDTKFPTR